ncbi:MAG TPA: DUF2752 domain-containing protein [Candidatus Goldiibacteriota bacterium]|nr:DUF2752 domain-containing protein [Candidatus Goldiibacteriota bacterium]HPI02471.1 DUF2752 domain-containing protein [Candidatus Goldiibacteriota bacterium]HPN63791.1 DUF2752 domain-containing protein [Candidatus Goldiibacteriota bacterium]HRQ44094.1 DUF2752 domain-containing protein [Candidatus Goldiibacteriota bacterium]
MKIAARTAAVFVLLLCFYLVPHDILFSGKSVCLYKNLFGFECPGCGLTRAAWLFIHLKFQEAFALNKLIVIVFPAAAVICGMWIAGIKRVRI